MSLGIRACQRRKFKCSVRGGKDEKLRLTNLEWGVDFLRLTNLVKTSLDGQI